MDLGAQVLLPSIENFAEQDLGFSQLADIMRYFGNILHDRQSIGTVDSQFCLSLCEYPSVEDERVLILSLAMAYPKTVWSLLGCGGRC